jgi:integrase
MTTITEETTSQATAEKPKAGKKASAGQKRAHVAPKKGKSAKKASPAKKTPKAAKKVGAARDGSKAANVLDLLKKPDKNSVANLKAYSKLAGLRLDEITAEHITGFVAYRQASKVQVSTLNADLVALRRVFHLAVEWGRVSTVLPRVRMLPGENRRERVLNATEEQQYLAAAADLGHLLNDAYRDALKGIRAVKRRQMPRKPDAYLLRDAATILIDTGLRPDECFRLKWADNIRDGAIEIHSGKGRGSRRRIPASQRALSVLEMRRAGHASEWIFPAPTKSGHVEASTLKKQHAAALTASGVAPFVLYTFRHTCITRWAKYMDPFTLHVLAGHTDMNTTKRYVHPSDEDIREAMNRVDHHASIARASQAGQVVHQV